jgi:PTS system mannose-specific IIB component
MANIVNTRIDERLIHGQIAAFWANALAASRIMVIDDIAAGNELQKNALKMAAPSGCKLSILHVERAVEKLNDPANYVGERIFCIFRGTDSLRKAVDLGFPMKTITVGNISNKLNSVLVVKSISVTPQDVENLHYMEEKGVKFYVQQVPSNEPKDFVPMADKALAEQK